MKKYVALFLVTIFVIGFMVGCQPKSTNKASAVTNATGEEAVIKPAPEPVEANVETAKPCAKTETAKPCTAKADVNCPAKVGTTCTAKPATVCPAKAEVKADANSATPVPSAKKESADVNPAPAKPAAAVAEANNAVAVTVNGFVIHNSDVEKLIAPSLEQMKKQNPNVPPQFMDQYKQSMMKRATESLIVNHLLDEKVKAANITADANDVLNYIKEIAAQQKTPLTVDELKALIEAQGKTFDEWKNEMQFDRVVRYQKLMDSQWAGKIDVNEADARKYYDENKKMFDMPEQVRASHILIKSVEDANNKDPNAAKAVAKAKAEDLLKQIKDGADFATLAKENSVCPSAVQGGDLGFFERGRMVPAFENAAFKLKVGENSDVVETQFGYHIIKATDHKVAETIAFDKAKDDIIKELTQQKQSEFAKNYIETLKKEAKIEYPPGREPLPNNPPMGIKAAPAPKNAGEASIK